MIQDFRTRTNEDLLALQVTLRGQYNYFTTQTIGGKSYTKDIARIEKNLDEIAIVLNERRNTGTSKNLWGITDFSNADFGGAGGGGNYSGENQMGW